MSGWLGAGSSTKATDIDTNILFQLVDDAVTDAKNKLTEIQGRSEAISIGDMFEMQMLMNHLAQLSEMSTSVVSAAHGAISSMARNVK